MGRADWDDARFVHSWVDIGGLRIHARVSQDEVAADALPIVLVHGIVISSTYMMPFAELLAPYRRVYALDLAGFGESQHPENPLDIPGQADVVAGWMRAFGLERAVLYGNSLGCQVIVDLAARYPQLAAQLIMTGPTVDRDARNVLAQLLRLLADLPYERPSLLGLQARAIAECGLRETLSTTHYALADRIEAKLPRVAMPTLVVCGEHDHVAPPGWSRAVTALLPRGRLHFIPGAGHALNYSAPQPLFDLVLPFLNEV